MDTHRHRDRGHCKQLKQHGASHGHSQTQGQRSLQTIETTWSIMDTHRHRDSGVTADN